MTYARARPPSKTEPQFPAELQTDEEAARKAARAQLKLFFPKALLGERQFGLRLAGADERTITAAADADAFATPLCPAAALLFDDGRVRSGFRLGSHEDYERQYRHFPWDRPAGEWHPGHLRAPSSDFWVARTLMDSRNDEMTG